MILLGAGFKIAGSTFKSSKKDLFTIRAKEMTKVDALYNNGKIAIWQFCDWAIQLYGG